MNECLYANKGCVSMQMWEQAMGRGTWQIANDGFKGLWRAELFDSVYLSQ